MRLIVAGSAFALLGLVLVTATPAQIVNRRIQSDWVDVELSTKGPDRVCVRPKLMNFTEMSLDFSTDVALSVNGGPPTPLKTYTVGGAGGNSCIEDCSESCVQYCDKEAKEVYGRCACGVVIRPGSVMGPLGDCIDVAAPLSAGDTLSVVLTATAGSEAESFTADDTATVFVPNLVASKCAAGKSKCVSKLVGALLKCSIKGHGVGALDGDCIRRAKLKFDGGDDASRSCFAKVEAKGGCATLADAAYVENTVDAFVDDIMCQLDPSAGTCPMPTPPSFEIPTPTPTP